MQYKNQNDENSLFCNRKTTFTDRSSKKKMKNLKKTDFIESLYFLIEYFKNDVLPTNCIH